MQEHDGSDIAKVRRGLIDIQRIVTQIHISSVCLNVGHRPGSAPIHIAQQENVSTLDARDGIVIGGVGADIKLDLIPADTDIREGILIQTGIGIPVGYRHNVGENPVDDLPHLITGGQGIHSSV